MMRMVPTPARASREARAEPVAPQPTMAMREAVSLRWPSDPISRNSTCREYLPSGSKEVTSSKPTNHYDRCHVVFKMAESGRNKCSPGTEYNIALYRFIER